MLPPVHAAKPGGLHPSMNHRHRLFVAGLALASAFLPTLHAQEGPPLKLNPGDHIAIVGNALADRLQFSGWLETYIQARYPDLHLCFRNLSAAGDEVATWHRSKDFGTRDEWLAWTQADVIFAFYGFGEATSGYEGIGKFKADLDKFLKDTAKQNYSGKGAPRIVLFSPIAQEKLSDPNYPDPSALNTNLHNYAQAMAEVAKANGVRYVDLFTPSEKGYAEAAAKGDQWTTNGHYLRESAEKALAPAMYQGIFGDPPPTGDLSKLNAAVLDKDWQWHLRMIAPSTATTSMATGRASATKASSPTARRPAKSPTAKSCSARCSSATSWSPIATNASGPWPRAETSKSKTTILPPATVVVVEPICRVTAPICSIPSQAARKWSARSPSRKR